MEELNVKNNSYSFVLQHKENRIIFDIVSQYYYFSRRIFKLYENDIPSVVFSGKV